MTRDSEKPDYWTPEGEMRNQLQNLAGLLELQKLGGSISTAEINKARKEYLKQYLNLGGTDQSVIESLSEKWTPADLGKRFDLLNKKKINTLLI